MPIEGRLQIAVRDLDGVAEWMAFRCDPDVMYVVVETIWTGVEMDLYKNLRQYDTWEPILTPNGQLCNVRFARSDVDAVVANPRQLEMYY